MADIDFWPYDSFPSNINEIVQPENAVQIIRDLIMKVN